MMSLNIVKCVADQDQTSVDNEQFSMTDMIDNWQKLLPYSTPNNEIPTPLNSSVNIPRDPRHPDGRQIDWQEMLCSETEDTDPAILNIANSEFDFLDKFKPDPVQVRRQWDVDSFIARVTTLAVHSKSFYLSYRPSFLKRITQNLQVSLNGLEVHKYKNIEFGFGALTAKEYHCHVVFPKMVLGHDRNTHLSVAIQTRWFDEIVIPSVNAVCPTDVLQHHPRSYADAVTKSEIKKEIYPGSIDKAISLHGVIQHCYLQDVWNEIVRLASRPKMSEFNGLFLIISGHDLKHSTKQPTALRCRENFLSDLQRSFHCFPDNFPPEDCWLDLGIEDTPISVSGKPAVTLLHKSSCLQHWKTHFNCPSLIASRTLISDYLWGLVHDVSSTSVQLKPNNILYQHGIAYNKSYNLHKALFATPFKGHRPFSNPQLEALAFSQKLLETWYTANQRGSESQAKHKRQALLKAYKRVKARMATTLQDSMETDYGKRQEYRIRIDLFEALELKDEEHIENVSDSKSFRYVIWSGSLLT